MKTKWLVFSAVLIGLLSVTIKSYLEGDRGWGLALPLLIVASVGYFTVSFGDRLGRQQSAEERTRMNKITIAWAAAIVVVIVLAVYLPANHIADVLGGLLVLGVWVAMAVWLFRAWKRRRKKD